MGLRSISTDAADCAAGDAAAIAQRLPLFVRAREADIMLVGITLAAILLFVGNGSAWLQETLGIAVRLSSAPAFGATSLILNIALILFCWQRYRALRSEITLREHGESEALDMAQRDMLTGLYNRRAIQLHADSMVARWSAAGLIPAALMIDIDNFKSINDLFGHVEADGIIRATAQRLLRSMPPDSLVARVGGDEFVVLLAFDKGVDTLTRTGDTLVRTLSEPIVAAGVEVPVSCSIGSACSMTGPCTVEALLQRSDHAMYEAKRSGRCRHLRFDGEMAGALAKQTEIESHLTQAIDNGEFSPVYEPLINLRSGVAQGYEMLARWHSPALGDVTPSVFIPLIEDAGLIALFTDQLMRRAMHDASDWPDHISLSVNISPIQLRDPWFAQKMLRLLADTRFPGARLIIEITETALVDNLAMVRTTFESLRNQGVRIALDDFGTGYSSIARLRELPFDSVKIDRDFVTRMTHDATAASITEAVLQLSQSLGLPVVAEGIENDATASRLSALNCAVGQGRLYGASMTGPEVKLLYAATASDRATA